MVSMKWASFLLDNFRVLASCKLIYKHSLKDKKLSRKVYTLIEAVQLHYCKICSKHY